MSAHTPAPWTEDDGFISGPFNKAVAELPSYDGRESKAYFAEQDANANLICAAPELLEALQMLVGAGEMGTGLSLSERINNARAAIDKATGESS